MSAQIRKNSWERFPLEKLNRREWEALCDGCGKCCLIKLENEKTEEIHYTRIACHLFDEKACKCKNYELRKKLVKNCVVLNAKTLKDSYHWMPLTCAYRLIFEGKKLEPWHHLVSKNVRTVHEAGMSIRNSTISELKIPENNWEAFITTCD